MSSSSSSQYGFGIAAALAAPLVMTIGFIVWDDHWKGSAYALNLFKCCAASIGFIVLSTTTRPPPLFPSEIFTLQSVGYLLLSSTVGILIGDWTWLKGLKLLGARRVILMDSLKPFLAAIFGWLLLGEELLPLAWAGMVLTVMGVLLVGLEKAPQIDEDDDEGDDDGEQVVVASTTATAELTLSTLEPLEASTSEEEEKDEESPNGEESTMENSQKKKKEKEETPKGSNPPQRSNKRRRTARGMRLGYAMSILNVVLDTYGAVLIKQYGQGMTVWEINLIRFGFAGGCMLVLSLSLHAKATMAIIVASNNSKQAATTTKTDDKDSSDTAAAPADETDASNKKIVAVVDPWYTLPLGKMSTSNWIHVSFGVLLVTFLTPSLSNYALFQIAIALAITLSSVGPLYSIPLSYLLQKEVPTWRAMGGAVLTVAGVFVLAFYGTSSASSSS